MPKCDDTNQSAIEEVRDQLFLDKADGARLDNETGNLGLTRPTFGIGDSEWRAAVKQAALQPKKIRNIFYRMIEVCVGPQTSRIGVLEDAASVNDREFTVEDPAPFVQLGTVVIDSLLPSEETVRYCIRDLTTGKFQLESVLQFDHTPIPAGTARLKQDENAGVTSLHLIDPTLLPDSGFPYPVMVDQGLPTEEIVRATGINTFASTVVLDTPTVFAHKGSTTLFINKFLAADAPKGRTFIQLGNNDTRVFPASGWIRLNHNVSGNEVVEYESNDVVNNILYLRTPLANNHVAGNAVELVTGPSTVSVAQVVESGIDWQFMETDPKHVQVLIPKDINPLRIFDASWLHGDVPGAFSTTLSFSASTGDSILRVTSPTGFPKEAGMVLVNTTDTLFYTLKLALTDVTGASVETGTSIGDTSMSYTIDTSDPNNITNFFSPYNTDFYVVIDRGGGNEEYIKVSRVDPINMLLYFRTATISNHVAGETVEAANQLILDAPLTVSYVATSPISLIRVPYGGTNLEDGNIRDNTGAYQLDYFPGGYIFDVLQEGFTSTSFALDTVIPPVIRVAADQAAGTTNLEVTSTSIWPSIPFTPFTVRIGSTAFGLQEDLTLIDNTRKAEASATVTAPTTAGDTSMTYTLATAVDLPESDGVAPAGYRVIIDRGGGNEEIITVDQNDTGTTTLTFTSATVNNHLATETIELLNDVLTFETPFSNLHYGPQINPSRFGETVQAFIEKLDTAGSTTGFPGNGGTVWINFGKEVIDSRSRVATITTPTSYVLESTDNFPTSNYPYPIVLGEGTYVEEIVYVSNNNTGTDTLTFVSPGAVNTHVTGEYAAYHSGTPETVDYDSKDSTNLYFATPQLISSMHLNGERVMYTGGTSQSASDGTSYGFKLPPDPSACLRFLFDIVRAAGVQVDILLV